MKISKVFYLTVFGFITAAALCFSACGNDGGSSAVPEINTATVTSASSASSSAASTTAPTAALSESVTSSAASESSASTTSSAATSAKPVSALKEAQLEKIAAQQKQQLEALTISNRSRYLELMESKQFFTALYSTEKLSAKQLAEKIAEAEESYFRLNSLAFSDMEIVGIADLVCVTAPDNAMTGGVKKYTLTYTAVTKTARISMEGTVLDDNGTLRSAAMVAEGMIP